MRRLLALVTILLLLLLGLSAAGPAIADDPSDEDPSPSASSTPPANGTADEGEGTDNTTADPSSGRNTTGDESSYETTYRHYLAAWARFNETQEKEQQARATYEDAARRCAERHERACQEEVRRHETDWERARVDMEEARDAYRRARAAYEEARDAHMADAQGGRRAQACAAGERATKDGSCVKDRSPEPSLAARAERERAYGEWQRSRASSEAEHRQQLDLLPEERRRDLAQCATTDAFVTCRHVSFVVDAGANAMTEVQVSGGLVFSGIIFPGAPEAGRNGHGANLVRIEGDGWRLLLSDGPAVPMHLRGDDDHPILLRLAAGVQVDEEAHGLGLRVPTPGGVLRAHIAGDVSRDQSEPMMLVVHGDARFLVHGRSAVLDRVDADGRAVVERAIERGRMGAEMKILRGDGGRTHAPSAVVGETILYDDMRLELAEGGVLEATGQPGRVYTVTVDADVAQGRTIALSFQEGLLDAETLAFRYFNVEDDGATSEAIIIRAADLADVLDPDDDGTVSEWWLVRDEAGLQVLVSIPGFSIHKIELASLDVILKEPSLVLGLAGAAAVVTLGLMALFRRPQDD